MKQFLSKIAILLLVIGNLHASEVMVFAAASLSDALKEIAVEYQKKSGDKIIFNLGASSTLARQIEEGAPADIFFSADESKMHALEKKNLIRKKTRKSRLSNSLVIVVAAEKGASISTPADLRKMNRIALAETKTVPAGIYAKAFLEKKNLWSSVESKIVPTENVRAALAAVESGNVDAGIVYKTDARISKKVKIACEVPIEDGPAISYPVAVMREAKHPKAAEAFLDYLNSKPADDAFQKYGFIVRKM